MFTANVNKIKSVSREDGKLKVTLNNGENLWVLSMKLFDSNTNTAIYLDACDHVVKAARYRFNDHAQIANMKSMAKSVGLDDYELSVI